MVDPYVMKFGDRTAQEEYLLFCIAVAGKNSDTTAAALGWNRDFQTLTVQELEAIKYMRQQVREYPDDEATPSSRFDRIPQSEKDYIISEYERIGGK